MTTLEEGLDLSKAQKHQLEQLNELAEISLVVVEKIVANQQQRTKCHDKFIKKKVFQRGDWAFLYDSQFKDFKRKLCSRWMGPYEIDTVFDNRTVRLVAINEAHTPLIVNGHRLRLYHRPVYKDSFIRHLSDNFGFEIVSVENSSSTPLAL